MNNTNIENIALKFVILQILAYDVFETLVTEYIRVKASKQYSLFCIIILKLKIIYKFKSSSVETMSYILVAIVI